MKRLRGTIACILLSSCSAPPPAPTPPPKAAAPAPASSPATPAAPASAPEAAPAAAPAAPMADAPPLDPARLAELQATIGSLLDLCNQVKGASSQGRARMIQKQIDSFLASDDMAIPFRGNLERMVTILSETDGDEPSEEQKAELRKEIQSIAGDLGIQTGSTSTGSPLPVPVPGPPGPPGPPVPGPPGPRPPGP